MQLPHGARLRKKTDSLSQQLVGLLLKPLNGGYMTHFWTTIGRTIYVPSKYDADADWGAGSWVLRHTAVLNHELKHVEQGSKWGMALQALMYVGPAPFLLLLSLPLWWVSPLTTYVLLAAAALSSPLTIGLAYGRWRIEREAYQVSRMYGRSVDAIVNSLWKNYAWTWPRAWMKKWFETNQP